MKFIRITFTSLFLLVILTSFGQTTREEVYSNIKKSGGVYYTYPEVSQNYTPAPQGYNPFYISHYGRHGSRYLIEDNDYFFIMQILDKADSVGVLTDIGRNVRKRLDFVWKDANGLAGELTPLGYRQQRDIAERAYYNFPEVFKGNRKISARATVVVRCVLSMATFCETLKGLSPGIQTNYGSGNRYMKYLNYWNKEAREFTSNDSFWREDYRSFSKEHVTPDRLMRELFTNQNYVKQHIDSIKLMIGLYWVASEMQNTELVDISFYDIFEEEELFNIWQVVNYQHYVCNGTSPIGREIVQRTFLPLLKNILDSANEAIKDDSIAATLRFGHDGNIMPLTGLLELENCYNEEPNPKDFYKAWSDFKIAPMSANVQMVFYRRNDNDDDILVKFMLHEKETSIPIESKFKPYYYWKDVEAYYREKIKALEK